MDKFKVAARKATATFLFATLGVIVGANVMALDVATWQLAVSTGIGALLNLAYRWSEAVLAERKAEPDAGAVSAMTVLVFLGIAVLAIVLYRLVDINIR